MFTAFSDTLVELGFQADSKFDFYTSNGVLVDASLTIGEVGWLYIDAVLRTGELASNALIILKISA